MCASLILKLSPHVGKLVSSPDPPKKWKEGLVFWKTLLVTWGGVEWHKECNYCILHVLHAYQISCSIAKSLHIITHSAIWFEVSDWGAVTRKVAQNTRSSLLHMRGGSGHETTEKYGGYMRMRPTSFLIVHQINPNSICAATLEP